MILAAKVRYAIRAMLQLSRAGKRRLPLRSIAAAQQIPEEFLGQIFLRLCATGLVGSARGPAGGYFLNRPAGQISLLEVVRAIDKSLVDGPGCTPSSREDEAVISLWSRMTSRASEELKLSLENLLSLVPSPVPDWQI